MPDDLLKELLERKAYAEAKAYRRAIQAAMGIHGATFDKAKDVRASMTTAQLRDYAQGPSVGEAIGPSTKKPKKGY